MTNFHQGVTHHEPEWIDQTPGARSNKLPGPWPIEDDNRPDAVPVVPAPPPDPTPGPPPPVTQTFPVFDVAAADDPVIRASIKANFLAAMNRWNGLIGYSRQQRDSLRATWRGGDGVVWNGSRLWPRAVTVDLDGTPTTFTKVLYFAGGTAPGSTVAFAGRVQPRQNQNINQLSQGYILGVNTDLIGVLTDAQWKDAFAHELAHALGMQAPCWSTNVDPVARTLSGGAYPTGRDNYRTLTSSTASNILLDGNNSHWEDATRNGIRGFTNELLIPNISASPVISSLTLGVARDQGYQVIGKPEGVPGLTALRDADNTDYHDHTVNIIYDDYYEQEDYFAQEM